MIFLDQPYVSDFLRKTIREYDLPVVLTEAARAFGVDDLPSAITEQQAVERARSARDPNLYMVSESSIGWIAEHLADTPLPARIEQFKNKAAFRKATASLFPDFRYREITLAELDDFDPSDFPLPFVIKPTVGFFSLGVQRVGTAEDWPAALAAIKADVARAAALFPREVLDTSHFLLEQCIEGREFAMDAYYDAQGEPVILSVLEHIFASESDTSDRVYVTSREIVLANLERFTRLLEDLGRVFDVHNLPVHVEVRIDADGTIWPIEVNPMRFGGWCTTADLTHLAFGVNPYACYFEQGRPDWDEALRGKGGQLFAIVALGNSTGIDGQDIQSFDHDALVARFEHPLELRKTDFRRYPIFGFVFTQTRAENFAELDWALRSDLREFVTRS